MDLVTVVNRSKKPLEAVWDGKRYALPPGKSAHPAVVAEAAKRQNPIMGSEDPYSGEMQYLIGIEEYGDPCDPAEQTSEIELMSRRKLHGARQIEVVPGTSGLFSVRDVASKISNDTGNIGFDKRG
jgi:hypothetical protein